MDELAALREFRRPAAAPSREAVRARVVEAIGREPARTAAGRKFSGVPSSSAAQPSSLPSRSPCRRSGLLAE